LLSFIVKLFIRFALVRKKVLFIIFISIGMVRLASFGQLNTFSNIRYKNISPLTDTIFLDSLSIVPGSIFLSENNHLIDTSKYMIEYGKSLLIWKEQPNYQNIVIRYRVFPYNFHQFLAHKNFNEKKKGDIGFLLNPFEYRPEEDKFANLSFGGLDYSGNLTRGISFGNNQDLILNSSLNLQMSGKINPDIEVLASLTDNNIPIQPEGNTQQLQQFEKIFIQLKLYQHHLVTLGDLDNSPAASNFLKYYRNAQGFKYNGELNFKKYGQLNVDVLAGVARGKFAKNNLSVTEGNQGPYKLKGNNGETYIIIIAGSERVFVNGVQLKRGLDQDYTIDYNLGEIVFTPKRIITKDLRVSIEFNYAERNYLRTTLGLNLQYSNKKFHAGIQIFSEQDGKNQSSQQKLDGIQKNIIRSVGDSLQNAVSDGIRYETYNRERIQYKMIDTITPDAVIHDSVFVYDYDSTHTLYGLSFTQVGQGKGNYKLAATGSNGRVYQWVAPQAGVLQGDYEPIQILIAPSKQQMFTFNIGYDFNKKNKWNNEIALSNNDPNTFSNKDNSFHQGYAVHTQYENIISLRKRDSSGLNSFYTTFAYEYIDKNFNFVERYRDVQFNRNWNTESDPKLKTNEHLASMTTRFVSKKNGAVTYSIKNYTREKKYLGFEHLMDINIIAHGLLVRSASTILHAISLQQQSLLIRPVIEISYAIVPLKGWRVGVLIDNEFNRTKRIAVDTFLPISHDWQQYKFYFQSPDSVKNKYAIKYTYRAEKLTSASAFKAPHFIAQTYEVSGDIQSKVKHQLVYTITYRHVHETDTFLGKNLLKNYYLGRIEYRMNELKGFLRATLFYELGAGREPKTEFAYIEAPNGYGQYAYKDLNNNGIRELNEYYISQFADLNRYIKIFNTTTELVSVNNASLNFSVQLNPFSILKRNKPIEKLIGRFSTNSVFQLNKKLYSNINTSVYNYFNPLPFGSLDSQLVSTNSFVRNSIYFNRTNTKYSLEYNFTYSKNKSILTNGFDTRKSLIHNVTLRWNIFREFSITTKYNNGFRSNYSDYFEDRRYKIMSNESETEFAYIIKHKLRFSLSYKYSFLTNTSNKNDGQFSVSNGINFETKYTSIKQGTATAKISFINVGYSDQEYKNSQVEFAMLQGLQTGKNILWGLSYSRKISENIEMTITYDGRKTGTSAKIVNTGGAQLRAYF